MATIREIIEESHKKNIDRLVKKFGERNEDYVISTYNTARSKADEVAADLAAVPSYLYPRLKRHFKAELKNRGK